MAMDYEVRPEFEDSSLSELLDTSVMCFQGVGDNQNDILQRFFGVSTVRDLANLHYFLWSLGIQELALQEEGNGNRPVEELAQQQQLKFSVRQEYSNRNARELLDLPIRALDGLSPAEALALYDGFRITNVTQFVQNRIMLEARIIEYLQKVESGEISEADTDMQIASILLAGGDIPDAEAARKALAGGEGGVGRMAGNIAEHLRSRLDDMKNRAREKAGQIAARPTATSEELAEDASRVRPGMRVDRESISRVEAIRGSRKTDQITEGVSSRQAMMDRMRASTESATTRRAPPTPRRTPAQPSEPESVPVETATAEEIPPSRPTDQRTGLPAFAPWIAAAAVAFLIAGGVWIWLRSTEPPISVVATLETEQGTQGVEEQPAETPPADEITPSQTEPGSTAPAQTTAGEVTSAAAESPLTAIETKPPAPPPLPVRAVHRVRSGQSLWRISRGYYHNPELWPWIYRENRDKIDDPEIIFPRQQINIPEIP